MIHALVLLQATHKSERESVGNVVTMGHVKSIAASNKASALEANAILNKAAELADALPDGMSASKVAVNVATLAIELATFVLNLDSPYKSMQDISKKFTEMIVLGGTPSKPAGGDDANVMQTEFEFSRDGSGSNAGMVTAKGSGFKEGALIEPKKHDSNKDIQYVIKYVNEDGSVGAAQVLGAGEEAKTITAIVLNDLVTLYRPCSKRIRLFPNYPANAFKESDPFEAIVDKGVIAIAFCKLNVEAKYKKIEFRAQEKPINKLFAEDGLNFRPLFSEYNM